jgi:hypothetical protein
MNTSLRKIQIRTGVTKKKTLLFRPKILSRHPSHDILRSKFKTLPLFPFKSVIRFGSTTDLPDTVSNGGNRIEINTISAIKISANKLLMKKKFVEAGVKTAQWFDYDRENENWFRENQNPENKVAITDLPYPIVAKCHYGSKGDGNTLIKSQEELESWIRNKNLARYIFEKFHNYGHEFRLHVTKDGYFYTCRKALKKDVPNEEKWHFHDSTCVWFLEENENFNKPNSWNDIVSDCVNALNAIGADILSFDVKVQSPRDKDGNLRPYQDYILLECNSASSMGDYNGTPSICAQKYITELSKILLKKN